MFSNYEVVGCDNGIVGMVFKSLTVRSQMG